MSSASRKELKYRLVYASCQVSNDSDLSRLYNPRTPAYSRIADGVAAVRGGTRPRPYDVQNLIAGKTGGSPESIFELGEGLWHAGVRWMTGALSIRWVPEYLGTLVGLIGQTIADGGIAELKTMWPAFCTLTSPDYAEREGAALKAYYASWRPGRDRALQDLMTGWEFSQSWTDAEHRTLRAAWRAWTASHEDASGMLPEIQSFLALRRLPASVPLPNSNGLEQVALRALHDRIVSLSPDSHDPQALGYWLERQA